MVRLRNVVLLVGIVVAAIVFGGVLVPLTIQTGSTYHSIYGVEGRGGFDPDGDGFRDQVLSRTRYITSWHDEGESQDINGAAGFRFNGLITGTDAVRILSARYRMIDHGAGDEDLRIITPQDFSFPIEWPGAPQNVFLPPILWTIEGPHVGEFEIQMEGYLQVMVNGVWELPEWITWAWDSAALVSGIGSINIVSSQPVEVGQDVVIGYNLGVATDEDGSGGWQLSLKKPADKGGAVVTTWTHSDLGGDFASGQVSYYISPEMFLAGSDNRYQVYLYNSLLRQDDTIFVTIDDVELAPGQPTVSWSVVGGGMPNGGETIVLDMHSEPNSVTQNPIREYDIVLSYSPGSVTNHESPTEQFSFVAFGPSTLTVTVSAYDGVRSSAPREVVISVGAPVTPPDDVPPGTPSLSFSHDGSESTPVAGDSITLTYSSEQGTSPIQSYTVSVYNQRHTTVQTSYSFDVIGSDDIFVTVTAFDGTLTSAPKQITIDVGEGPPEPPDDVPPGTPSISFSHDGSHEKPWAGDRITLEYISEPGTNSIQSYAVSINGVERAVSPQESYGFVVDGDDDITVMVIASDGLLTSEAEITIDVGFQDEPERPDVLIYAVAGAAGLFVLFILLRFLPIPRAIKVMIFIVAIVVLIVVIVQFA